MKRKIRTLTPLLLLLVFAGCETSTDKVDSGGVILSITDFDGLPIRVSVGGSGELVQVETLSVDNVIKDPNGVGSALMNVELQSYEVIYTRADSGSRVPPKLVAGIFGVAPAGGNLTLDNLPVMAAEQFSTAPLLDLYPVNGGIDSETGDSVVTLNLSLQFFGRTLSGDAVISQPARWTIEFVR